MSDLFYDIGLWLDALGGWGYVLAPVVMALVAIFPIPAEAPALVNGMLFGPLVGTAITWLGALAGAQASFELARWCGRPLAERFFPAAALARADRWAAGAGWPGLLGVRLVPVIAFTLLNWGAGLTSVPRWRFLWTTAVGILPGAILFTASGYGLSLLAARLPYLSWGFAALLLAYVAIRVHRRRRVVAAPPVAEVPAE
ncbi:MAG: TVP38/TMEM64 family protein [Gemmatimonadota bacterium]